MDAVESVKQDRSLFVDVRHYNHYCKDIIQQLRSGVISVWKHDMSIHDKPQFQDFIIKISGVWENDMGCGLTYKFI